MLYKIEMLRLEASGKSAVLRTITDVSVNIQTCRRRAEKIYATEKPRGANAFRIRNASNKIVYAWQAR